LDLPFKIEFHHPKGVHPNIGKVFDVITIDQNSGDSRPQTARINVKYTTFLGAVTGYSASCETGCKTAPSSADLFRQSLENIDKVNKSIAKEVSENAQTVLKAIRKQSIFGDR